jgi:hypothetical protein
MAVQRERLTAEQIGRERAEAAQGARQDERIKQLEREARRRASRSTKGQNAVPLVPTPAGDASPVTKPSRHTDNWPAGSGYTVILASLGTEQEARATQRRASDAGLDTGLLNSSDFSSLRPGYWVVFSGTYAGAEAARPRQGRVRSLGFADAYVRFVSR